MPGGWELFATSGIVILGGIVTGATGFGFALFAVPPLLLMHEPLRVVVLVNVLAVCSGAVVVAREFNEIRRPMLRALIPWACLGLITGALIIRSVDTLYLKLAASIIVVIFSLHAASRLPFPGVQSSVAPKVAGYLSGVLGTTTGLNGPPVALLLTARSLPPKPFRVTITTYFVVIDAIAVGVLFATGQLSARNLLFALAMVPPALLGRLVGRRVADLIPPARFRQVVVGMLLLTGLSGTINAIVTLR
jgi:uncharacterized membrane protein YfcA